jgi:hypothetical protein
MIRNQIRIRKNHSGSTTLKITAAKSRCKRPNVCSKGEKLNKPGSILCDELYALDNPVHYLVLDTRIFSLRVLSARIHTSVLGYIKSQVSFGD